MTKILMNYIDKQVPIKELVLKDTLVFLVETYLKPVLGYSSEIGHCKIDFHNIYVKLHWIGRIVFFATTITKVSPTGSRILSLPENKENPPHSKICML